MKLQRKVANNFDGIINILAVAAGVLIILLMLSVTFEITERRFLNHTIPGLLEAWEYTLLWITLLAAPWVLKLEGHVKMDLLVTQLKPGAQAAVATITSILAAISWLLVAWFGGWVTWGYFQTGHFLPTILEPLKWPIFIIIPVGSLLLFIQFLRRASGYLREWRAS